MANRFNKILVVGRPGSGKTRFSDRLGRLTGRKITHLDKHIWGPNWKKVSNAKELRRKKMEKLTSANQWVLDGHYLDDIEKRIEKADTIVLFDMPIWQSFYGIFARWVIGRKNLIDQPPGKRYRISRKIRHLVLNYDNDFLQKAVKKSDNRDIYMINNYRVSNKILKYIANEINISKNIN